MVVLVAIVATAGAAVGLVIDGLQDGKPRSEAAPTPTATSTTAAPALERARAQATKRRGEESTRRALAESGGDWPARRSGYTVVLANTDRASAERFAESLKASGEDAGVIPGVEHPNLGEGLFLVFVGSYSDEVSAAGAAARLGESHQGAYPQFIQAGSSTSRPEP